MPTETGRHRLYEAIKHAWGEDNAAELMSYLPPVGWADVATKHDLDLLRSEMDALRSDLRREMAELRTELRGEMAEVRTETARGYTSIVRWNVATMVAMTAIFATLVGIVH